MDTSIPRQAVAVLLEDAARRDMATARRVELLALLLRERYLAREQLIVRVEGRLGTGCFGDAAWEDVFYRDLRVVKEALRAAGFALRYSRAGRGLRGYYLAGQPPVSPTFSDLLRHAIEELDRRQLAIFRRLTPAERFRLSCSVTDAAVQSVAQRVRHPNRGLR